MLPRYASAVRDRAGSTPRPRTAVSTPVVAQLFTRAHHQFQVAQCGVLEQGYRLDAACAEESRRAPRQAGRIVVARPVRQATAPSSRDGRDHFVVAARAVAALNERD